MLAVHRVMLTPTYTVNIGKLIFMLAIQRDMLSHTYTVNREKLIYC